MSSQVFLGVADQFTAADAGISVYGNLGFDTVTLAAGTANITIDQNVDQVVLSGTLATYQFRQSGNLIRIFNSSGATELASLPVQGDADGTAIVFADGQTSVTLQALGVMKLGGATVSAVSATPLSTPLAAYPGNSSNVSAAQVYLGTSDGFTAVNSGLRIYGNSGNNTVTLASGASGVVTDQNTEKLVLNQPSGSFTFRQSGNLIEIHNSTGTQLLARTAVQSDADGTLLAFSDGTYSVQLLAGGIMKLGGGTVSAGQPAGVSPGSSASGLSAQAAAFSKTENGTGLLVRDADVESLVSGYRWNKTALTYSFNTSIPSEYFNVFVDVTPSRTLTGGWSTLSADARASVTRSFSMLQELLDLTFLEVPGNSGDIRLNVVPTIDSVGGFAYLPGSGRGGDVFLSASISADKYQDGETGHKTVIHELGHAMGLKHPFEEPNRLAAETDRMEYTVMSYTPGRTMLFDFTYSAGTLWVQWEYRAFPFSFQLLDIAAMQSVYGANLRTRPGDDSYTVRFSDHVMRTIWDAGGTDTIDASLAVGPCTVDLRAGQHSSLDVRSVATQMADTIAYYHSLGVYGADNWVASFYADPRYSGNLYTGERNLAIAHGVWIENVSTGAAADSVRDNAVNNVIRTGGGDDTVFLYDGGFDTVDGGAGQDRVFVNDLRSATRVEKQADGNYLLVSSQAAAILIGVESVICSDGVLALG